MITKNLSVKFCSPTFTSLWGLALLVLLSAQLSRPEAAGVIMIQGSAWLKIYRRHWLTPYMTACTGTLPNMGYNSDLLFFAYVYVQLVYTFIEC